MTIITADINKFDFDWKELSKKQIVNKLKKLKELSKDKIMKLDINYYIDFLSSKEYNNEIILDMKFGDYIRKSLDNNKPVLVSFNWQLFFKKPKTDSYGKVDSFKGDFEEHQVVVNGYDDKGVFIIDSHHEMYHGDLEKYQNGRYKIDWETLHTVIGFGDVVLADDYNKENIKYELV